METPINVPLGRNGKYGQLVVDTTKFAPHVHDHVYVYGLRQILNDAIADKTDDDGAALPTEQLVAKAEKRLATLYSGELRTRRGEVEPADPVEAEAYRIAKHRLVEQLKATPEYADTKGEKDRALVTANIRRHQRGLEDATWQDLVDAVLAAKPEIRESAKRIARERAKTPTDLEV